MNVAPTPTQIRAQVAAVLAKVPQARVIGIRAAVPRSSEDVVQVNGEELPVASCQSVLEVRERLSKQVEDQPPLVLLTPLVETELGSDVVARLAKRRLFSIEPWQLVKERFHARYIAPQLVQRHSWVARALLETEPAGGYPPAPSGFVTAELVWRHIFETLLGIPDGARDPQALIEWTLNPVNVPRMEEVDDETREGIASAIEETSGRLGRMIFECAVRGGPSALSVGLVSRVLFDGANREDTKAAKAVGKLEARLGIELDDEKARVWADAAEGALRSQFSHQTLGALRPVLGKADELLSELSVTEYAVDSAFLIAGYEQRLERFSQELEAVVKGRGTKLPQALLDTMHSVLDHALAECERARSGRIAMATRLAAWLVSRRGKQETPVSFVELAQDFRSEASYVDWARTRVWDGDPYAPLAAAYTSLSSAVCRERESVNKAFGQTFAKWSATGSHDRSFLRVEDFIAEVLVPLAKAQPVLLAVIDGMSVPVFRELQADLMQRGIPELVRHGQARQRPVIAALPTVTEVSRASLFRGDLCSGVAGDESQWFSDNAALRAVSSAKCPPVLFHKGGLKQAESVGVSRDVFDAIAEASQRVVGVVINAVDDHLAKGEQVRVDWTAHRIRPLEELLYAAFEVRRVVVLISDHGHVLEHNSELRNADKSERWREAAGEPAKDEVLLQGPRVVLGKGNRLIAPWSEKLRYGSKKNGYHGGATPQEVIIPLGVYTSRDVDVEGWVEAAPEYPTWWALEPDVVPEPEPKKEPIRKRRPQKSAEGQGDLFPKVEGVSGPEWINRLMASDVMEAQQRANSRTALPQERIRLILIALDERGGKLTRPALARKLGVTPVRLGGILSALRRLLNVEGYTVLSIDDASDTVELNREYLNTQFNL